MVSEHLRIFLVSAEPRNDRVISWAYPTLTRSLPLASYLVS